MDLVDLIEQRSFLGSEFLMWLWFKSECYESLLKVDDIGSIELEFDDQMTLEAYIAETQRSELKGGDPANGIEAKTALRQGKRLSKAKISVNKEGRIWVLTLKGESLDFSSVKIPALLTSEYDERFYERMYLLDEIEEIMSALYLEFLQIRLSKQWEEKILPATQAWIQSDKLMTPTQYPLDNK